MKRRFAIAGAGVRGLCFARALVSGEYRDEAGLVALYDRNLSRMKGFNEILKTNIPLYTDLEEMVAGSAPTHLIICTPDATHHEFIEMAFRHGWDAICEKPMAVDAEKVRYILELEKRYDRRLTVAFNYRFVPYVAKIKDYLKQGTLGKILSVTLEWHLDKVHGAEYFRRWHSDMKMSGGLLVHKATHHFDLINWLLDDVPQEVSAFGALRVYGKNSPYRGERCFTCPHAGGECRYEMKTHRAAGDKEIFDKLYWEAEAEDGYIRDRCLFDLDIDIYDTMNVLVKYRDGAQLSYALNAYSPVEGYRLMITGTDGRLEASESHSGIFMYSEVRKNSFKVYTGTSRKEIHEEIIEVDTDMSDHAGGDKRLYRNLFTDCTYDPLGQMAGSYDGAMSCLIGIGANISIERGMAVSIPELLDKQLEADAI